MTSRPFKLLSYNIHQGITARRNRLDVARLRDAIASLDPDVVLLQEVIGTSKETHASAGPFERQMDALAVAGHWPHVAYAGNAQFASHGHGNAILSRFPIESWRNEDISVGGREPRGILHARVRLPGASGPLDVLGTHLGLCRHERGRQLVGLCRYADEHVGRQAPLVVAGDFNDWRGRLASELCAFLGVGTARAARTYPSRWPLFALDRIYFRGLALQRSGCAGGPEWRRLSDHLPLWAEFDSGAASAAGSLSLPGSEYSPEKSNGNLSTPIAAVPITL